MGHFMLDEIKEQPAVLRRLVASGTDERYKAAAQTMRQAKEGNADVFLVASGSSYHACLYGQYLFSLKNRLMVIAKDSGEFASFVTNLDAQSVVIMVSQSGESADAIHLIPKIKNQKSKIIAVTGNSSSTLAKNSDIVLDLQLGECRAIPSTKGYTAELATFAMISEALCGDNNFSRHAETIARKMEHVISLEHERIRGLADKIYRQRDMFVLGHSIGLANAAEGALKLKECAHVEAEAYAGLEFRHGPSSIVDADTPVIVIMADYNSEEDLQGVVKEMKLKQALVIGLASERNIHFDYYFESLEHNLYSPLVSIIPLQLLAYELALSKELDPDAPQGVSRIVT